MKIDMWSPPRINGGLSSGYQNLAQFPELVEGGGAPEFRRRLSKCAPESQGEVAVTGISHVEGKAGQIVFPLRDVLEGSPQAELVQIFVDRETSLLAKYPADVVWGIVHLLCDIPQR